MKKYISLLIIAVFFTSCSNKSEVAQVIQGKVERDELAVVGKIAGRMERILVHEGDFVKKGDTLAILDIPEVQAKKAQAKGAVKSAAAQYEMSVHGATSNQLKQLNAKKAALTEQYQFAKKSLSRLDAMVKDSLIPQQQYDEVFAKYQGAQAQMIAVDAEIADVKNGVRLEQQTMALGQQDRALGALEEVSIAESERYILAPQDMQIETITLKVGELALPGYTLFKGSLQETTYFRFTIPESLVKSYEKGKTVQVTVPYKNATINAVVQNVKQIGAYANIASAYPDYDMQDPLYELTVKPATTTEAKDLLSKSTVTLKP
ncbi:biotin/lipoyl-binding protein [Flavobacterium sp. xlx-214]|uniref:HlyD family secretion protein n=1 Tax=unclassified Flavobacterium TaxID=196869 RepID=UPI0013D59888|nr:MULTISPECIES: biotin/lipoyl-binding protein [unclassified Flavobacterium]MBA5793810.1 biotin/lipoyl-binding protein [Flavobacterium sp. xlx-221]QMI82280.1 biotin/lipoyl-binding protein [Flavobacterium sp. xlx-214]